MDQNIRHRHAIAKPAIRGLRLLRAAIGVGRRGQIGLAQLLARRPGAVESEVGGAGAIAARCTAEDAREIGAAPARFRQRIVAGLLVECRDTPDRHVEQGDLGFEDVAEQARDSQRHVDARPVEDGQRHDFDAGDAARRLVPGRAHAEIGQRLGEIVATGAKRCRGPEIDDQGARILAVILQVSAHHLVGRARTDDRSGARRNGARIDRGEIPTGRQDVGAAARGRTGWSWRHASPVERRQKRRALVPTAGANGNIDLLSQSGGIFGARRQHHRFDQGALRLGIGCLAIDVQTVADAQFLDVAELGIELRDGSLVGLSAREAAFRRQAALPRALYDLILEEAQAAPVEPVSRGIFLDEAFHLSHRAVQPRRAEGRRQVADGDSPQPTLGLHRLAGIVDDEGIDHRHRAQYRLGPAFGRERQRLARQPFERAMGAEMDERVDLLRLAQPRIHRDIGVTRRTGHVVVACLAIVG